VVCLVKQVTYQTRLNYNDVETNQLVYEYFTVEAPDKDAKLYQYMLLPKLFEDVKVQISDSGIINIWFHDFEKLWVIENFLNYIFGTEEDPKPLKWLKNVMEIGKRDIPYKSQMGLATLRAEVGYRMDQYDGPYMIMVPTKSGFGCTSKIVDKEEYRKWKTKQIRDWYLE
jgi:hypothetical protein